MGDYRPRNIVKELKKLQQKDTSNFEVANAALSSRMAEIRMEMVKKDKEIRQLKVQTESLERIRKVVGNLSNVLNKVSLFNNDIKTEGQLSTAKIIPILVNFACKMETMLVEIRKLVPRSQAGPSQPPLPSPAATPQKGEPLVELKTPLPQHPMQELVAEVAKIGIPAAPASAKMKRESETPKTTSSKSSPRRMSIRMMKKEPTPELESEEEEAESSEEVESSSEGSESEEEAEPTTPLPEKKKKMDTWAYDRKKPTSAFKTLVS